MARTRKLRVVQVYEEKRSAAKKRPVFDRMLDDARAGRFDVLLVWAIDRFGRSMLGNVRDVLELDRVGVELVSAREPWLDNRGPVRSLLIAIFSWVAEQERAQIVARTKAGMARARAQGKHLGRPRRLGWVEEERIRRLRRKGRTQRQIAMATGIPRSTLRAVLGGKGVAPRRASRARRAA